MSVKQILMQFDMMPIITEYSDSECWLSWRDMSSWVPGANSGALEWAYMPSTSTQHNTLVDEPGNGGGLSNWHFLPEQQRMQRTK